jgi:hypothetical protein
MNNVEWVCSFGHVFLELVAKLISFSYSICQNVLRIMGVNIINIETYSHITCLNIFT